MEENNVVIGMFGTCGDSRWRDKFIERYKELGISFYNPQVENWTEDCASIEAHHLATDKIILFPVTSETYAQGSLCEVGFSIMQALRLDDRRSIIVMIDQKLDEKLDDKERRKDSLRSRALNKEHLKKMMLDSVYVVDNLDEMLEASIVAYRTAELAATISKYNAHRKKE